FGVALRSTTNTLIFVVLVWMSSRRLNRTDAGKEAALEQARNTATELQSANQQLRLSEERLRLLVDSVKDYATFMLDTEGKVISWNKVAEQLTGYQAEEILGKSFQLFYPPESLAEGRADQMLKQARDEGRSEDESWRVRKDGSRFWGHGAIVALRNEGGVLTGYAKV